MGDFCFRVGVALCTLVKKLAPDPIGCSLILCPQTDSNDLPFHYVLLNSRITYSDCSLSMPVVFAPLKLSGSMVSYSVDRLLRSDISHDTRRLHTAATFVIFPRIRLRDGYTEFSRLKLSAVRLYPWFYARKMFRIKFVHHALVRYGWRQMETQF